MDVKFKQRLKKRRTRKKLDELRKRAKVTKKLANTESNNELEHKRITNVFNPRTSKRLTLALFNKTITSKTITRDPPPRSHSSCSIDLPHNDKTNEANCSDGSNNNLNNILGINNTLKNCKQNIKLGNLETERLEGNINETNVTEINLPYSVDLFIPSHYEDLDSSACEVSYNEFNCRHIFSNASHSRSKTEPNSSLYERFMKELPRYLKEYFPSLSEEDNFRTTKVRQKYFENQYEDNDNSNCIENKFSEHISKTYSPLDYLQMGNEASPQEQQNQRPVVSVSISSSSCSSPFKSNSLFLNSPECIYFPHKLNE